MSMVRRIILLAPKYKIWAKGKAKKIEAATAIAALTHRKHTHTHTHASVCTHVCK